MKARLLTIISNVVVVGTMILLVVGWLSWQEVKAHSAEWMPIKFVRIRGAFQYISKQRIKQVIQEQLKNGFYYADIQLMHNSVDQLPWVEKVKIKRVWPDAIEIQVEEQVPVVRWGTLALLNNKGEIFHPQNIKLFKGLPIIVGSEGNEKNLLDILQKFSLALKDQNMFLKAFRVNNRRAWSITLKSGMELRLGRNNPENNFQRFLKTLPLLGNQQVKKIAVADLRYPNGYSLTWKQAEDTIDWKQIAIIRNNKAY